MKIAQATYSGPMKSMQHKGPSGKVYDLRNPMGGDPRPVDIESVDDAIHFEEQGSPFTVKWSAIGLIVRSTKPPLKALKDLGYRKKQKVAKQFGIKANQTEDELEEELQPYVEELENKI